MNRALRVFGIFVVIAMVVVAIWKARTSSPRRSHRESLRGTTHSAITHPVAFARNRFTGGVGAALGNDRATGALLIMEIMPGSPAEIAGLRKGDHVLQVDGIATSGRTLAENVESIRGFSAGSVTLTVQRAGSTNREYVIHRSSWKALGIDQADKVFATP